MRRCGVTWSGTGSGTLASAVVLVDRSRCKRTPSEPVDATTAAKRRQQPVSADRVDYAIVLKVVRLWRCTHSSLLFALASVGLILRNVRYSVRRCFGCCSRVWLASTQPH